MAGMPKVSKNGLETGELISALQKHVRRSDGPSAYRCAVELLISGPQLAGWMLSRLTVISYEDVDAVASPHAAPFVANAVEYAKTCLKNKNAVRASIAVAGAIRVLAAAKKGRQADHWACIWCLGAFRGDTEPPIPDYALDCHTRKGRGMGRGDDHFRAEGAKLIDPDGTVVPDDEWIDEAYESAALGNEPTHPTLGFD